MKTLLLVFLIQGCSAALIIKGPTEPVVEGDPVTMECLTSDLDLNISHVHFEVFSKYLLGWHRVPEYSWCYYSLKVSRGADGVLLSIPRAAPYYTGRYRCVADAHNGTMEVNSSLPLDFTVHYMGDVSLIRDSYSRLLSVPDELKVRRGEEVELKCSASSSEEPTYYWHKENSDWFLPSSTLTLRDIDEEDEGQYTCVAQHLVKSLNRKHTLTIRILSEDAAWHQTSNGRFLLMTSVPCALLLLFFLSLTAFVCHRTKRANTTSKGPIDDHSQKKPIYKTSVDSIPDSTSGDKQPLV